MIVLDENIPLEQKALLRLWRIQARMIGQEIARSGISDNDILALLHSLPQPTFFTRDRDFFSPRLAHQSYSLVWIDAQSDEFAYLTRRFLRHPAFRTKAMRRSVVARVHNKGISFWKLHEQRLRALQW
jgi:hypothetical protein